MPDEDKQLTEKQSRPPAEAQNQAAPLTRSERIGAWIVGGIFSTAGIVAILVLGKDGAGSLALVAVGALFLLVAVAEVIPTVFKLGSNEMTVRRTVTAAERYALRKVEEAQERTAEGDPKGALQALESVANPPEPELALSQRSAVFQSARNDIINGTIQVTIRVAMGCTLLDPPAVGSPGTSCSGRLFDDLLYFAAMTA